MKKFKLINKQTGEEHLCEKVVIDGWDYYVSDNHAVSGDFALYAGHVTKKLVDTEWTTGDKKVIATNNPNIDVPKVVDETWEFFKKIDGTCEKDKYEHWLYKSGYNKSQETHPFSEEDMKKFGKFCIENNVCEEENRYYQYWELLQLWKEQKSKTVYYNG